MKKPPQPSTAQTLRAENAELRARLEEAEEMLRAIRAGEVDGLVVEGDSGPQLFALQGADAEQSRLRAAMLAQVSDAVVTTDGEDRITFLNPAAEQQYRVRSAEVLGRKITELYTRRWPSPEAEAAALAALEDRGRWCGEKLHRTRDGRELPVEASIAILYDPETGQRAGLIVANRDITGRKEAEAALTRNTALFSKIIEQAPGGVYVVDAQFRLAQMNAESLPFFASAQPLMGRDFDEVLEILWGPVVGPQCASIFRHTLATGERYVSPRFSELRHDLGVEQAFEWETQRITLPDGQHGVVCYFQDVTARERAAAALRKSENHLRYALQAAAAGAWDWDIRSDEVIWSPENYQLYDLDPAQGPPSYADWESRVHPEDRGRANEHVRAVLEGREVEFRTEFRVVSRQGAVRWLLGLGAVERDRDGQPLRMSGLNLDITERKRAEVALRESERKFRGLLESAPDGMVIADVEGVIVLTNAQTERLFGYGREELLGQRVEMLMPARFRSRHTRHRNGFVVEPHTREMGAGGELLGQRKDGSEFPVEISLSPLDTGEGTLISNAIRDITERKQAEAALRESEARLGLALTGGKMGMWEWDMQSGLCVWNAMEHELLGLNVGDCRPSAELYFRYVHPEDLAPLRRSLDEVRPERPDWKDEFRIIRADGALRWLAAVGKTHYGADGRPERMVGVNFDITESKQSEAALRANEERMRLATAATAVGIWEWNVLTGSIRWDAQMFQLYGMAPTADGNVSYDTWRRAVLPEDLARQEKVLLDTVARLGTSTREFRILRADNGECRWIQAVETVSANKQGKAEWAIGTSLDVTAQKNAERAIREEAQRKDEFLAMLGHELRNPLTAIRHAVQISGETPDDAEACQWAAQIIDRQSQQLSRMVDDLLDVARINRGRIALRVESLDLGPVLEQAVAVVRPLVAQRRQTIKSHIGSRLHINGDPQRLEQVFVNLFTNAAKYTPEWGSISLHAHNEDGEVVVTITDNGVGIPAELLPHVFDLFRQADSTLDRAQGGLGIGLSVVKSLIEMHLGRITVESRPETPGTTVTVRLPLLLEMDVAPAVATASPIPADPTPAIRLLIVDDHQDAAQALARLLQRRACEVRCAHAGPDGVALAREFHPEVLLLDLGLPGFDGYEVARILRAEEPFADALFIAISGYAQDADRQRCLAAGFNDHFAKPLDFSRLIEAIRAEGDRRAAASGSRFAQPAAAAAEPAARHPDR